MSAADVLDDLVAFHRDDVDPVARCSTADPRHEEDWGRDKELEAGFMTDRWHTSQGQGRREDCSRLGHRPSQKEQR